MATSLPNCTVRKQRNRLSISGVIGFTLLYGLIAFLSSSLIVYFVAFFGYLSCLTFLLIKSVFAPYFGGIDLVDGRVETVTGFGGILSIPVSQLDAERSSLSVLGLLLVPHSGEELFMPATEYAREDILRVAHYAGLADHGWSQYV